MTSNWYTDYEREREDEERRMVWWQSPTAAETAEREAELPPILARLVADAKHTLALKAKEAARSHDWVIDAHTVGSQKVLDMAAEVRTWHRKQPALSGGERAEVLRHVDETLRFLREWDHGTHEWFYDEFKREHERLADLAARLRSAPSEAGTVECHYCRGHGRVNAVPPLAATSPAPEQRAETTLVQLPISRTTLQRIRNADVGYWLHDYEVCPNEVVDQALAAHDLRDALSHSALAADTVAVPRKWRTMDSAPRDGTWFIWCMEARQAIIRWPEYAECFDKQALWRPCPEFPTAAEITRLLGETP